MNPKGKLVIIGGAVDKGSFTEKNFEKQVEKNLNFFAAGFAYDIKNRAAFTARVARTGGS